MRKVLKYINILLFILLSAYLLLVINNLNLLPRKYLILFVCFIILFNILASIFLLLKNKILNIISYILYFLLLIISIIGIKYGRETIGFLNKAFNNRLYEVTTYDVIVLSSSAYHDLNDLNNLNMAYLNGDENYLKWMDDIRNKITINFKGEDDLYVSYDNLINLSYESLIIDDAYLDLLEDYDKDLNNNIRVIYTFDVKKKIEESNENVELEPINIYLSGSDSRSDIIYNKSRSDVNMIITINPNTKTILTTSIPRDYYVMVHGQTGLKDKLTHAGIYGVDVSRMTMEDLFNIDIKYSIKVGFSSVVKVVDLVGGVDIDSDRTFNSYHIKGWTVNKGINHMDGAHALAYARERYAYPEGDRHRVQNQQQVFEAVIEACLKNTNILFNYQEILNSLSDLYVTDIPKEYIQLLVKKQIEDMDDWTFINQTVSGSDLHAYTHTAPSTLLYVMVPYDEDVKNASNKIKEVLEVK